VKKNNELFNEVNKALGPYKALEKRLVFFHILHIILEIEDVTFSFDCFKAIYNLNFDMEQG
jgi:hypothetical protein